MRLFVLSALHIGVFLWCGKLRKTERRGRGGAKYGRRIWRGVCIFSYAMSVVGSFSYLGGGGAAGRRTRGVAFRFLYPWYRSFFPKWTVRDFSGRQGQVFV